MRSVIVDTYRNCAWEGNIVRYHSTVLVIDKNGVADCPNISWLLRDGYSWMPLLKINRDNIDLKRWVLHEHSNNMKIERLSIAVSGKEMRWHIRSGGNWFPGPDVDEWVFVSSPIAGIDGRQRSCLFTQRTRISVTQTAVSMEFQQYLECNPSSSSTMEVQYKLGVRIEESNEDWNNGKNNVSSYK